METEQKHVAIAVVLIALVLTGAFIYIDTTSATIDVIGNAVLSEKPDKAVIYFRIETLKDTSEEASKEIAKIAEEITRALYFAGISKEQITTHSYTIYLERVWTNNEYKEKGYRATQTIKVEIQEFGETGRIVDLGVNNGALIDYINFELSEEKQNQLKTETLKQASKNAKEKAEGIAQGLGKRLGRIISVHTNDYNYYPYRFYEAGSAKTLEQAVTEINPDELDIRATVTVRFKIW